MTETIKQQTGIEVAFYADNPLKERNVEDLPYKEGDVLLRMNFFGMRGFRCNNNIPVPVIEDHTHEPLGQWALNSDADWCITSLRKTLPLPEGGLVWSPKGHKLTIEIPSSEENEKIASARWKAMEMKTAYLQGENVKKEDFRRIFAETEQWFDSADPAIIDGRSLSVLTEPFDFNQWFGAKRKNWTLLDELLNKTYCQVIMPERESCTMFSLVMLMENKEKRDSIRKQLIENSVYPAILWDLPQTASDVSRNFSERMLSVHCDGRYSEDDVRQMARILTNALRGE